MDPVRRAAREDPEGDALVVVGEGPDEPTAHHRWSWRTLDAQVDAVAVRLWAEGVAPGTAVVTVLPPGAEALILQHAIPRIGGVLVPLHPGWTIPELQAGLRALATVTGPPSLILASASRVEALARVFGAHIPVLDAHALISGVHGGQVAVGRPPDLPLDSDTPLAVLLTSGTSGTPKPVPLTRGNLETSAEAVRDRLRLDPADRWLWVLSPAHVGGLALVHRAAVVGSAVVVPPAFDPKGVLALAEAGAFTHASLVPVHLQRLLAASGEAPAPRGIRCVLLGGAATPEPLLTDALARRWPVALTYGMTEATSQIATSPPDAVRRKPGAVGRPLPGVDVRLDASGEILVQGPTVALLSPSSKHPQGAGGVDAQGVLHTGDLGRFDADGDLWIVGRKSHRIISGGVTVEPAEVERVLAEAPGVGEVTVVGVPDPAWGERIVAYVVATPDAHRPPTRDELLAWSRPRLAPPKRPREVIVVSELPRNANGKIDRTALVRRASTGSTETGTSLV
jgi:O-succinylbenzoic acid--CoA ligase